MKITVRSGNSGILIDVLNKTGYTALGAQKHFEKQRYGPTDGQTFYRGAL